MRVLSQIDGKSSAEAILAALGKFTEQEFAQTLMRLLEGGHIRIVADDTMKDFFADSGIAAPIDVMEISAEEFLKTEASAHGLESEAKIRQQQEAEVRAKAHAEEQLKLEAAARAQKISERELLEVTSQLGNSTDEHINKDPLAEQKARDAAIARAKTEAEKIAHSIAAEKAAAAQQAAESKVREANTAQSKPDTDHGVQRGAEEKARIAAEREAAEKAQQEAAAIAKREAEEKARLAAELKAQEEAERVARRKAEAEEKTRREAEEKARIAAEREAAEKVRQEAAAIAKHEAEEKARVATELKAREEAERTARRNAEAEAKAQAREKTKHEAEARALIKAEEKARLRAEREPVDISKWIYGTIRVGRNLLISLSASILVLLLLLQLVNLGMLVSPLAGPVEKLLSDNINEPVSVKKVYASLWPKPHLVLDDITIGGLSDIKIDSIHVLPGLTTLFDKTKTLTYIKVSGFNITQDNFHRPRQWLSAATKLGHLKFDQILLEKTLVSLHGLELPVFDGELNFAGDNTLQSAILNTNNHKTVLQITPRDGALAIELAAEEWQLPIGAPVLFDELNATGIINNSQLDLTQIKGRLYGGNIKAAMSADWAAGWAATGNFKLSEVDLEKLMPVFSSQASIDGPVTSNAAFTLRADDFAKLLDNPEINADFSVDGGSLNNIDLGRAMKTNDKNAIGGSTRFSTFNGKLTLQNGNYRLRQLALKAGQLNATGEVDIMANQDLSGVVNISLATKSRDLQSRLNLSGKASSPSLK